VSRVPPGISGFEEVFAPYWEAVCRADARSALAALEQGLAAGHAAEQLVRSVVARAQEEVGRQWESGQCSVADEHAATAIGEQALALLRRPVTHRHSARRRVVLACAPGEWHSFPARLAGDLAERVGVEVVSLGASCPAEHLGVFLRQVRPDALALSVTMTVNLLGAWKAIQTARLVRVPVVVGGAAWGPGHLRSDRLGADMRVEDPSDLARAVNLLAAGRPVRRAVPPPDEVEHVATWCAHSRREDGVDSFLARAAAAAVACEDATILEQVRTWLTRSRASGGVSCEELRDATRRLVDELGQHAPLTAAMLAA
jgi:methanogenic corrinoid protein MtbC1